MAGAVGHQLLSPLVGHRRHRADRAARSRHPSRRSRAGGRSAVGRRARAREAAVRVVPVRMVVRDAQGRGAAAARPGARRARRRHRSEGRLGVQPPVERRVAGVRRRRVVLQARRRRALGRLPAVLPDVPLPSSRAGLPRRAVPAVDARQHRRHGRRGVPESAQRARLRARRRARARLPSGEGAEGVQRDDARRAQGPEQGRIRQAHHQGQRRAPSRARRRPAVEAEAVDVVRLSEVRPLRGVRRRAEARVRARGRRHARLEPGVGHRLQRRRVFAHRRRAREIRRRHGRRLSGDRQALSGAQIREA